MIEQTIFVSDDGRRFDTSDECQEWESMLVVIRKVRQRLWEHEFKTSAMGQTWCKENMGEKCTDDYSLNPDNGVYSFDYIFYGRLDDIDIVAFQSYIFKLKQEYSMVFE